MAKGNCLCGAIAWQLSAPFPRIGHCHCTMCQKAHGASFASYVSIPVSQFTLDAGESAIKIYKSSSDFKRAFCNTCGSVVPVAQSDGVVHVPAGGLQADFVAPGAQEHIFVDSRATWTSLHDDIPAFSAYPARSTIASVRDARPRRTVNPSVESPLPGSCLCGWVHFEVLQPFSRVHHCHCQRCRTARSAVYTTNGFTACTGVRFAKGAEHVHVFKLPDAQFFTQAFCRHCGSGLPRLDAERDVAVVPLGALDATPNVQPMSHIFVADKAAWFEIPGSLPQFLARPGP